MLERDVLEDRAYYLRHAREEREVALLCEDNCAALAHLRMADEYDRRARWVAFNRPPPLAA